MNKILGLDLGTNSIGWALIENSDSESKILGAGSRIIPMSQDMLGKFDSGQSFSQTAERTAYRSTRRLRERHLQRRERLHRVLNILGYLPDHYSKQIDFVKRVGQFMPDAEPKLPYIFDIANKLSDFLFKDSFEEMLQDFRQSQPQLLEKNKKIPYDWTIYYLRKKALTEKIKKEELAWLLLNFNQKRGYYQLRGEDEEQNTNKLIEFYVLEVIDVKADEQQKGKEEIWYNIILQNGWIYRRSSKTPLFDWKGKTREFIVTTDLDDDKTIKKDKDGKEKRSFKAVDSEKDWIAIKKSTEDKIATSNKTVGVYIYETLLSNPDQKIKGKLVRVIERKFYKDELERILITQQGFHPELVDKSLYQLCLEELYENNLSHRVSNLHKDFANLFLNDIIFYQRPLKSKKSLISNCKFESRTFVKDGKKVVVPIKCIAKSHPLYQEFRLWKWLKDLRVYKKAVPEDIDITAELLTSDEARVSLFEFLNDRKEIDQAVLLKYPSFNLRKNIDNYRWNYVEDKIYPCNETRAIILSRFNKTANFKKDFLTRDNEEALWHILYSVEDKADIEKALKTFAEKKGFGDDFVDAFKKVPPFKKEYGGYSAKAIKKLLPLMRLGRYWDPELVAKNLDNYKANIQQLIIAINLKKDKKNNTQKKSKLFTTLERLLDDDIYSFEGIEEYLASYVVYGRHSEDGDIKTWDSSDKITMLPQHSLRNPIVEQVINETLQVVRDIWIKYGNGETGFFNEIHIELGREMKSPKKDREKMTKQVTENENTNLRIKALLIELLNDSEVENVRPFSPMQQEILKIYEDGVLSSEDGNIPDEILKISKLAQPTPTELIRYKLWLEQKYRSPYTGEIIPLSLLFTRAYDIEHIIPQSRYFDNSFSNKVICEVEVNKDKDNSTAYEYIKNNSGKKVELSYGKVVTIFMIDEFEHFVKTNYGKNRSKMKRLLMDDIPESFIQRQLNDSRYISKVVKNLMSNIVREEGEAEAISKNVIVTNGSITSTLKQDWGLNDVWNHIVYQRFERLNTLTHSEAFGEWTDKDGKKVFQTKVPIQYQKGFSKKRIDHRHHALDAIVIACTSRNHINYLNNESALGKGTKTDKEKKRHDLKHTLCFKKHTDDTRQNYKWVFYKPWGTFTQSTKECLFNIVVSFKQNLRVINKSINHYQINKKNEDGKPIKEFVKQTEGYNWAVRKPIHKDTVSGLVKLKFKKMVSLSIALDSWEMVTNRPLKIHIKKLMLQGYDKPQIIKLFKTSGNKWNNLDISKVEISYWDQENAASRVKVDESFSSLKIDSITDSGIRKIMLNHLIRYDEFENGKIMQHPELAFSHEGMDELNKNILTLNMGKPHQPIYKVRTYEPMGNKFNVGIKGNKKYKFVEAAKGTNLFFAIYSDEMGKRLFDTIPFNIVMEREKQGLPPVPLQDDKNHQLLFYLSPNDLVFIPNEDEKSNINLIDLKNPNRNQIERIYKVVSSTTYQCFFIRNDIASPIVNKFEFSALNKTEKSVDGIMIKEYCIKLRVDRLGNILQA
jgi:CRISPR-associated endonuclease Csn1